MKGGKGKIEVVENKVGHPETEIDWMYVNALCAQGIRGVVIAKALGISPDTLYRATQRVHGIVFSEYRARHWAQEIAAISLLLRNRAYDPMEPVATIHKYMRHIKASEAVGGTEDVETDDYENEGEESKYDGLSVEAQMQIARILLEEKHKGYEVAEIDDD